MGLGNQPLCVGLRNFHQGYIDQLVIRVALQRGENERSLLGNGDRVLAVRRPSAGGRS
jgi:hypothetical protein